ncbi:hypothetical protein BK659_23445 [Pseudomonas brassicacearum]|uniref:Uncharacterized protein n=1 Tax=Pseudomonas brassicacearum TaxID=930166 RepID=A0A423GXR7_9PSED|nr:hypothetical protein BK659_23445 [Pseudomonas brassicacearum]
MVEHLEQLLFAIVEIIAQGFACTGLVTLDQQIANEPVALEPGRYSCSLLLSRSVENPELAQRILDVTRVFLKQPRN